MGEGGRGGRGPGMERSPRGCRKGATVARTSARAPSRARDTGARRSCIPPPPRTRRARGARGASSATSSRRAPPSAVSGADRRRAAESDGRSPPALAQRSRARRDSPPARQRIRPAGGNSPPDAFRVIARARTDLAPSSSAPPALLGALPHARAPRGLLSSAPSRDAQGVGRALGAAHRLGRRAHRSLVRRPVRVRRGRRLALATGAVSRRPRAAPRADAHDDGVLPRPGHAPDGVPRLRRQVLGPRLARPRVGPRVRVRRRGRCLVGRGGPRAPSSGALASAGALLADVFRRERDVALLTLHVRPRDAWLGDAKATRMRAVAVKRAQAAEARSALLRCMDAHGRVPTLAWSERPSKTVAVVYLRRAADSFAALLSMLERICRDHGLEPVTEVVTETAASSGGLPLTHHRLRAETPRGAKTSHAISAAVGRHPRKGEMLVLEYRRKEAEQAAYDGLKIIGTVVAVAALTGLVVVASSNIATAASEAAGAAGGYVARRRRRRGRDEETHDAAADASDSDSGPASSSSSGSETRRRREREREREKREREKEKEREREKPKPEAERRRRITRAATRTRRRARRSTSPPTASRASPRGEPSEGSSATGPRGPERSARTIENGRVGGRSTRSRGRPRARLGRRRAGRLLRRLRRERREGARERRLRRVAGGAGVLRARPRPSVGGAEAPSRRRQRGRGG